MTQDEINEELDGFLEEAVFNCVIDPTNAEQIKEYLTTSMSAVHDIELTEEQWGAYAVHCLNQAVTTALFRSKYSGRVQ